MLGVLPHVAAAQEAEEEAGVRGAACPTPLGSYRYRKLRANGASLMFDVDVTMSDLGGSSVSLCRDRRIG